MGKIERKIGGRTFNVKLLSRTGAEYAAIAQSNQAALEACVEGNTKCAKCKGGVRAQCVDSSDGMSMTSDLDIKVAIYCRDAACAWQAEQWRPWRAVAPKEL
jgi:hypothetical protein